MSLFSQSEDQSYVKMNERLVNYSRISTKKYLRKSVLWVNITEVPEAAWRKRLHSVIKESGQRTISFFTVLILHEHTLYEHFCYL